MPDRIFLAAIAAALSMSAPADDTVSSTWIELPFDTRLATTADLLAAAALPGAPEDAAHAALLMNDCMTGATTAATTTAVLFGLPDADFSVDEAFDICASADNLNWD